MLTSTLLHSDGNLHLLQRRDNGEGRVTSLSRLTEELSAIKSVLSNWVQNDLFFSSLSIPTACLVAVLSDAANNDTWNDEYRCLHATVKNAKKVKYELQLTGFESRAIWPVNTRGNQVRHVFLSHNFTLVVLVIIEEAPSGNTPLLAATLANTEANLAMERSCSHNKKWGTAFEGTTTTQSSNWERKKDYEVALMLQGNKASVYIDGQSLGAGRGAVNRREAT
ncbi:trans-sialidase, putative [Trypanosoma cruzi marinkellei]|uniref:Trans-sialidase, putative n=1 Tax=Trypanosoma cruzi marinkellei TaxID=85056 RepID=K2NGT8_TRYCR|nr:trans-sialidase, putative [Trypanosoma cruzi marinkellei]